MMKHVTAITLNKQRKDTAVLLMSLVLFISKSVTKCRCTVNVFINILVNDSSMHFYCLYRFFP